MLGKYQKKNFIIAVSWIKVCRYCRTMFLKLCVATHWYVILIFQGRRTKLNSVQFYSLI